ncbi:hypothetical protein VL20_6227 [Microcystis panniformis FACHB-1757]|uniref:Uncharacterized protein n=1 Tax=Microcystis panniformis FACHB-1757 TaxID=1638788 RepID=A0A0K1SA48_9CHRO|nr:hypothetical protein VL20_6227 [Microcystis panniformis FACHB-1757]
MAVMAALGWGDTRHCSDLYYKQLKKSNCLDFLGVFKEKSF